jgi:hypothetical protein
MSKSDEDDGEACESGDEVESYQREATKDSELSTTNAQDSTKNFIMSMDFNEPAIAIGGYCRLDPASLNQTRHLSQNRGAKSTKRRRKIISDDLLNSTTTSASISSQNAIKLSKRSLSNKR